MSEERAERARLEAALEERDRALAELARARAELDELRQSLLSRGEPSPPHYPVEAGIGPTPRRYLVADAVYRRMALPLGWLRALRGTRDAD